jgi:TPR repeat protein
MVGLVKIGCSSRPPEERAAELSRASGVPAPFEVVYDTFFNDCQEAERFVHTFLGSHGGRLSANREFFKVSVKVAVRAVVAAEQQLGAGIPSSAKLDGTDEEDVQSGAFSKQAEAAAEALLDQAFNLRYGADDLLEDQEEALRLYKQAAALGPYGGYAAAAEMYFDGHGCRADSAEGMRWLRRGAVAGELESLEMLARVHAGDRYVVGTPLNYFEARKCWRKWFERIGPVPQDDSVEGMMFGRLRTYIRVVEQSEMQVEDRVLLSNLRAQFRATVSRQSQGKASAKSAELNRAFAPIGL